MLLPGAHVAGAKLGLEGAHVELDPPLHVWVEPSAHASWVQPAVTAHPPTHAHAAEGLVVTQGALSGHLVHHLHALVQHRCDHRVVGIQAVLLQLVLHIKLKGLQWQQEDQHHCRFEAAAQDCPWTEHAPVLPQHFAV